jgi:hypothetical protein
MKLRHSPAVIALVACGFLMVLDTLLPWQSVNFRGLDYSRNAWHGFWGIVLGLLSVGFLVNAAAQARVVELKIPLPHRYLSVILAPAILVFAVIKVIRDSEHGWASWVGIVLGVLITLAAVKAWQAKVEPEAVAAPPPPAPPPPAPPTETRTAG